MSMHRDLPHYFLDAAQYLTVKMHHGIIIFGRRDGYDRIIIDIATYAIICFKLFSNITSHIR